MSLRPSGCKAVAVEEPLQRPPGASSLPSDTSGQTRAATLPHPPTRGASYSPLQFRSATISLEVVTPHR